MAEGIFLYASKDYTYLLGMQGFSDVLLNNHFKLYQGYVKNTNLVLEKLNALLKQGNDRIPEYAELKRRLGWEFNGMRLHEYYFENLGGKRPLAEENLFYKKANEDFGSFEIWKQDFISTALMRGIGWVVVYLDLQAGRLMNTWINEHHSGQLTSAQPILVLDVFEHAYWTDYQIDRAKYIDVFFDNLNWEKIAARFKAVN